MSGSDTAAVSGLSPTPGAPSLESACLAGPAQVRAGGWCSAEHVPVCRVSLSFLARRALSLGDRGSDSDFTGCAG